LFKTIKLLSMSSFMKAVCMAVPLLAAAAAQGQTRTRTAIPPAAIINSVPADISQFQAESRLITQNFYSAPVGANITGNFGVTARWNSMGSLNAGTQTLNGYRTQTNGRALVTGHSIANLGPVNNVSNPFIQWIGNQVAGVTPGNLEFKFAVNPGGVGAPAPDIRLFTMAPNATGTGGNSYAENGLVGQLAAGTFGNVLGVTDRWFGGGLFNLTGGTTVMGIRDQLDGTFLTHNIARSSTGSKQGIIGFGGNMAASSTADIQFLSFKYYDNPTLDPITGGDEIMRIDRKFKQVSIGLNNFSVSIDPARLAVFDGAGPIPSPLVATAASGGITDGIAVYGISTGVDNAGNLLRYSAAVVGDVANSRAGGPPIDPTLPTNTYAILGIADNSINIGASTGNRFAGLFIGDVGYTSSFIGPSDRKLKKDIEKEENIMEKIMRLKPVHYTYKNQEYKTLSLANGLQHGFISQELEEVFPEMVKQINTPNFAAGKNGAAGESFKGINYLQLIPVLTRAIQELNTKVSELEGKLAAQANAEVTPAQKAAAASQLFTQGTYSLSQNVPNPFSQSTTVTYSVPENTRQALLAIFDLNGKMIKQFNLQQGKDRQQVIAANTLKPGMYIYTLLADGVELLSKKMIVTE
jgi:Chaperone of endosialidase/Secretion system C-terminal sorting domain